MLSSQQKSALRALTQVVDFMQFRPLAPPSNDAQGEFGSDLTTEYMRFRELKFACFENLRKVKIFTFLKICDFSYYFLWHLTTLFEKPSKNAVFFHISIYSMVISVYFVPH